MSGSVIVEGTRTAPPWDRTMHITPFSLEAEGCAEIGHRDPETYPGDEKSCISNHGIGCTRVGREEPGFPRLGHSCLCTGAAATGWLHLQEIRGLKQGG
jgi:hypothetical protein